MVFNNSANERGGSLYFLVRNVMIKNSTICDSKAKLGAAIFFL